MKKFLILLILIFSFTANTVYASSDEEFLSVADGGGILSEAVERYIYTQNKLLSKKTGARIIIATAAETGELSVNEYARRLYDELGVSHIGRNNSVFIFICSEDKDYSLIVADGINAALTDSYAQKCLVDYMEEDFDKGDYDEAVVKTFNAFGAWYADKYKADLEFTEDMSEYNSIIKTEKKRKRIKTALVAVMAACIVIFVISALIRRRRKKRIEQLRKKRQERRKRYMQIK